MLHCDDYKILISALLDEEITEAERGDLMNHLEQCADCTAFLSDQLAMRDALRGLTAAAPAGFAASVMARVHQTAQEPAKKEERKVLTFPALRRWVGLAACCAVVALGVFTLGGLPRTMSDTANCAAGAPEAFDNGAAAAQTYMDGLALGTDSAAPDYGTDSAAPDYGTTDTARSGIPESPAANEPCVEEDNCKTSLTGEYAALLTVSGATAQQWVEDTLGEEWVSGLCYSLTAEEYAQLRSLLLDAGASFAEEAGTDESDVYLLLAE